MSARKPSTVVDRARTRSRARSLARRGPVAVLALALVGSAAAVAAPGLGAVPAAVAATGGSIDVSPRVHTGGMLVRFTGSIGAPGVRTVRLQKHMLRPGDVWQDYKGVRTRTDASGRFDVRAPANAMYEIGYRMVSGSLSTPVFTSYTRTQEVTLQLQGATVAGEPFTVVADTLPQAPNHPDQPPPLLLGREVALQERLAGGAWRTLQTSAVGRDGTASFTRTEAAGTRTWRVRQADWTRNGDDVGWFPSFPTTFTVHRTRADLASAPPPPPRTGPGNPSTASYPFPVGAAAATGLAYGWGSPLFDYDWEDGESLTSPPLLGTRPRGRWVDSSNGSGRASIHNGGLQLASALAYVGPGDRGSVSATMRGNARAYGRWDFRLRSKETETGAAGYRVRVELVPERPSARRCGAVGIVVADLDVPGTASRISVNARDGSRWGRTVKGLRIGREPHTVTVEVAGDHITWLLDRKPVATVRSKRAVPGVPLTARYSLVGSGAREMNHTQTDVDWIRGYSMARGAHLHDGPRMRRTTHRLGC